MERVMVQASTVARAKRLVADVRFGEAPREALLAYKEALDEPEFAAFLERIDPRIVRYLRVAPGVRRPSLIPRARTCSCTSIPCPVSARCGLPTRWRLRASWSTSGPKATPWWSEVQAG